MPSDPVELTKQIKAASDIVAVVGSYLTVKPVGSVFKALCPFHNDSRPSLDIDPKRQRYRCWSCGAHGDSFKFVQQMEKVGFTEARAILAARAGIKFDEPLTPQDHHRTHLLEVMRWAQAKYQYCLLEDPIGTAAVKYIASRKLSGKTVRDFGLGFAPLTNDCWLGQLAEAEGIPLDTLIEVGLLAHRVENRGVYERFRDRVMFPIRDVRGQVIAFGGRIMPESPFATRAPKYYNSAETPLFFKSDVLYGLDLARHAGASAGYLAVVEGYTDVMMAHQCGVPQVVATMGTALNARHLAQLRRTVSKVVLVYDADAGGSSGVDRLVDLVVSQDVEIAIASLPEGLDPCDLLIRPEGVETFKTALTSAVNVLDFLFASSLQKEDVTSVEGSRKTLDRVLETIAKSISRKESGGAFSTTAKVKQDLIMTRLASRLKISLETVWARFGELKTEQRKKEQRATSTPLAPAATDNPGNPNNDVNGGATVPLDTTSLKASKKKIAAERQLLEILLADPGLLPKAAAAITPEAITHSGLRRMLAELYSAQAAGAVPDIDTLRERLADRPDLFESALTLQNVGLISPDREQWLDKILKRIVDLKVEEEQRALKDEITGTTGDQAVELLRKLQQNHLKKKSTERTASSSFKPST